MSGYKVPGIGPEGHALLFLEELGIPLVPPIDPLQICEKKDIHLYSEALGTAEAILLRVGNSARILLNSANKYVSRNTFSIAHELGHYNLPGHNKLQYSCNLRDMLCFKGSAKEEFEANRFASELLMPSSWLKERIRTADVSLPLIMCVADECKTSLTATAIKIVNNCSDRVGVIYSEGGFVKWTSRSRSFTHEFRSGMADERSAAGRFFKDGSFVEGVRQLPPPVWLSSPCSLDFIYEETAPMPYLNATLTVVTLPFDEDEDAWLDDDSWR